MADCVPGIVYSSVGYRIESFDVSKVSKVFRISPPWHSRAFHADTEFRCTRVSNIEIVLTTRPVFFFVYRYRTYQTRLSSVSNTNSIHTYTMAPFLSIFPSLKVWMSELAKKTGKTDESSGHAEWRLNETNNTATAVMRNKFKRRYSSRMWTI